jgi:hypothetical protein
MEEPPPPGEIAKVGPGSAGFLGQLSEGREFVTVAGRSASPAAPFPSELTRGSGDREPSRAIYLTDSRDPTPQRSSIDLRLSWGRRPTINEGLEDF